MATVNIVRSNKDPFYRYKMPLIISKIEGKGNGIKTVIPNANLVAQALARPPAQVVKFFGMELGAQTKTDPSDERYIINGAHSASKLQDLLDGYISRFVLCKECSNPETDQQIRDDQIILDCKACGTHTTVDPRLKLSGYILKNAPTKKGKKDKSTKKADRKARKQADHNGGDDHASPNGNGSPHDSNSDHGDENGDIELEAGSDDEFTRKIQNDAKEIEDAGQKDIKWSVDTSEEAVKARAHQLAGDLKDKLALDEEEDGEGEDNAYNTFGSWVLKEAKDKGSVNNVDDVDIYLKAKELGIEKKHKTVTVLAQTLFDEGIVKQIPKRASMLKKIVTSDRHEKALLGGTERFVGNEKPELIPQVSAILLQYYQNDLISEEVAKGWGSKASTKYVDKATSKKVRKAAAQFIEWLENAESGSESEEDE